MASYFLYPTWSHTTSGSFSSIEAMGKHSKLDIKILVDVFFQMSLIPPYPYRIILVFKEGHVHCQNLYKSPHPPPPNSPCRFRHRFTPFINKEKSCQNPQETSHKKTQRSLVLRPRAKEKSLELGGLEVAPTHLRGFPGGGEVQQRRSTEHQGQAEFLGHWNQDPG